MRSYLLICAVLVISATVAQAQDTDPASAPAVAFISGQRISSQSEDGKAGQARVQALQREKANQLRALQQTLSVTRQELAKATTDEANLTRLQQQALEQQTGLERATAQAQLDLQNLQREISAEVQVKVRQALDELLKGRNIALVLQQETAIVWAAPGLDLTADVIALMDKNAAEAAR